MKQQQGFTLIELVMVIVILGILAATALPKFVNLQGDAKKASMQAVEGALKSAITIAHAKAVIEGKTSGNLETDGMGTLLLKNGYPQNNPTNIEAMLDVNHDDYKYDTGIIQNQKATTPEQCRIYMSNAVAANTTVDPVVVATPPVITSDYSGC